MIGKGIDLGNFCDIGFYDALKYFADDPDTTIRNAIEILHEKDLVELGDPVVILSDVLAGDFDTEAILLRKA